MAERRKTAAAEGQPKRQQKQGQQKEQKPKDPFEDQGPLGRLKREAAERLGLVEKIYAHGWGGLSSAEAGRVGALVNRLLRERQTAGEDRAQPPPEKRRGGV